MCSAPYRAQKTNTFTVGVREQPKAYADIAQTSVMLARCVGAPCDQEFFAVFARL